MTLVNLDELKATVLRILEREGYPPAEAETVLDVLLYAQLRGNNQGIVKLIPPGLPRDPTCTPPQIEHQTPLSALVDGGRSPGIVVVKHALALALERAREHGFGIVGTHNTRSSTGAIGYYANIAAQQGFIGLVFAGSGEYVAAYGAFEPILGTNPLAIGIPTAGEPLVLDMATSAIARYGIVEAQTANRPLPPDVAYDASGQPTTDPGAALAGAIRTFGGHKGAGLSLMVEILTGALVGQRRAADGRKLEWGTLIMVVDPGLLGDRDGFIERVMALVERVKGSQRLPGVDEVLLPGERGSRVRDAVLAANAIEIEDGLWRALQTASASSKAGERR